MVKKIVDTTYQVQGESINSVEKGNVDNVEDVNFTYVAITAGKCETTGKNIKLILKGKLAFFVYVNFLENINSLSLDKVCPTTGVKLKKIVVVSFEANVKEERSREIIVRLSTDSNIVFDYKYLVSL